MKTLFVIMAAGIVCGGCSSREAHERTIRSTTPEIEHVVKIPGGELYFVRMHDSTPCVVYSTVYGGGVDCNWTDKGE